MSQCTATLHKACKGLVRVGSNTRSNQRHNPCARQTRMALQLKTRNCPQTRRALSASLGQNDHQTGAEVVIGRGEVRLRDCATNNLPSRTSISCESSPKDPLGADGFRVISQRSRV